MLPEVNFSTTSGLVEALKNPAVNVRSHAAHLLVKKGKEAFGPVLGFLQEVSGKPVFQARALWVLGQVGKKGKHLKRGSWSKKIFRKNLGMEKSKWRNDN